MSKDLLAPDLQVLGLTCKFATMNLPVINHFTMILLNRIGVFLLVYVSMCAALSDKNIIFHQWISA